jgi:hypothetical protein
MGLAMKGVRGSFVGVRESGSKCALIHALLRCMIGMGALKLLFNVNNPKDKIIFQTLYYFNFTYNVLLRIIIRGTIINQSSSTFSMTTYASQLQACLSIELLGAAFEK